MPLRTPLPRWILIAVLLIAMTDPSPVSAQKKIFMQATFNPTQTEQGVTVAIAGRVFDLSNTSIPNAVISIQINNPQGTSVHLAVAYTDQEGVFQDSFLVTSDSPGGNYTAFLVASKPGYETSNLTLLFAYASPDFSIQTSIQTLSLRQGDSGTLTVTVLSLRGFREPVNLTALELPPGVTLQFEPASVIPSGVVGVRVTASSFASVGNYTITLLGVAGSIGHKVSMRLDVEPGPIQTIYFLMATFVVLALVVAVVLRHRSRRERKAVAVEELIRQASADKGYVATARAIARPEELRGMEKVDERTYERLRREYEKRLEKSK